MRLLTLVLLIGAFATPCRAQSQPDEGLGADSSSGSPAGPRLWGLSAGAGMGVMSDSEDGLAYMADAAIRPWGQHGIGARFDGFFDSLGLAAGPVHKSSIATVGYAYQLPLVRGAHAPSVDFLLGPSVGSVEHQWSEGISISLGDDAGGSSEPDDFESFDGVLFGIGGSVSPNLHLGPLVLGLYVSGIAGLAEGRGHAQLQAGLRLGLSDF